MLYVFARVVVGAQLRRGLTRREETSALTGTLPLEVQTLDSRGLAHVPDSYTAFTKTGSESRMLEKGTKQGGQSATRASCVRRFAEVGIIVKVC